MRALFMNQGVVYPYRFAAAKDIYSTDDRGLVTTWQYSTNFSLRIVGWGRPEYRVAISQTGRLHVLIQNQTLAIGLSSSPPPDTPRTTT